MSLRQNPIEGIRKKTKNRVKTALEKVRGSRREVSCSAPLLTGSEQRRTDHEVLLEGCQGGA